MRLADIHNLLKQSLTGLYPDREIESFTRLVSEHISGLNWLQIRINYSSELDAGQEEELQKIVERLQRSEPIQYILGETEFYGLKMRVRPGVLIPRGETEELVEWVVRDQEERIKNKDQRGGSEGPFSVLDIGCGSGAIAIALAKHLPDAEVFAVDASPDALSVTRENALLNGIRINVLKWDILEPASKPSDPVSGRPVSLPPLSLIVSNPPYIPRRERDSMDRKVVDYEPDIALFVSDQDPLIFYRGIARLAEAGLKPSGSVYVEVHHPIAFETKDLLQNYFKRVELLQDIHGRNRMIRATNG